MQPGDVLARGAKRATFDATNKKMNETEFDLRTLSKEEFLKKYSDESHILADGVYEKLLAAVASGAAIPNLPAVTKEESPSEIPDHVDNLARILPPKLAFRYEGQPFNDMVLVERVERESNSAIIIPDSVKAKSDMGIVVSVGDGTRADGAVRPIKVSAGELVLFDRYAAAGADIALNDKDGNEKTYLMLREYDILLRLTKVTNE